MDTWPTDDRGVTSTATRKGKGKASNSAPNFPDLEVGPISAVTLVKEDNRFKWAAIHKNDTEGRGTGPLQARQPVVVFPSTRPPTLQIPQTSILQRAEQGANFLRTYLPDVDVTAELIRDEVANDAKVTRKLDAFNPYIGNMLELVFADHSLWQGQAHLAFPMGALNRDLNISPFLLSATGDVTFKPLARPIGTFDTPIQQIVTCSRMPQVEIQKTHLAIRTFGSTSLLEVNLGASDSNVRVSDVAKIVHSDVGNKPIVDIKLSATPFEVLLVNNQGLVYRCTLVNGKKTMTLLHDSFTESTGTPPDPFWRIALGKSYLDCILASSKALKQLDFRTQTFVDLFSVRDPAEFITSVENHESDHVTRLCTTNRILWMDNRYPGKPLLGYKHGRQFDRTLSTRTAHLDTALTFLTSQKNGLVSVYDISRSDQQLAQVVTPPYCLPSLPGILAPYTGQAFIQHSLEPSNTGISMFRMSDRGNIYCIDLHTAQSSEIYRTNVEWSSEVRALDSEASNLHADIGPLGRHDKSEVDLYDAYDDIFRIHTEEAQKAEEENADAVYDLLEQMPSYWQSSSMPAEHVLTTYDVAFRASEEPEQASRADFLSENIINSKRGYRAYSQGRISTQTLKEGAAWHHNILSTLKHLDSSLCDPSVLNETLEQYRLAEDPERPAKSIRSEVEAGEQLTLDLALSSDVFAGHPFSESSQSDIGLESMTGALSLAGEPPPLTFGFLRPVLEGADHYDRTTKDEAINTLGVRLLLKDWDIGSDPRDYVHQDVHDGTTDARPIHQPKSAKLPQASTGLGATSNPATYVQLPPMVVVSSAIDPPVRRDFLPKASHGPWSQEAPLRPQFAGTGSQLTEMDTTPAPPQALMTSTQILPGPFGGRPSVGKKKPTKKRLGGF